MAPTPPPPSTPATPQMVSETRERTAMARNLSIGANSDGQAKVTDIMILALGLVTADNVGASVCVFSVCAARGRAPERERERERAEKTCERGREIEREIERAPERERER